MITLTAVEKYRTNLAAAIVKHEQEITTLNQAAEKARRDLIANRGALDFCDILIAEFKKTEAAAEVAPTS
jgi:hypothetical protein